MLNQTNQLQNRIDIGFVPIGLDMPYRIVVGNSPMNLLDPLGLKTYMCTKPLDAIGGSGKKSGYDVWGNPLYHQYICVKNGKVTTCGGQSSGGEAYGPGKPSKDKEVAGLVWTGRSEL